MPLLYTLQRVTFHLLVVGAGLRKVLVQLLHALPHSLWQRLQLLLKLRGQLYLLPCLKLQGQLYLLPCLSSC